MTLSDFRKVLGATTLFGRKVSFLPTGAAAVVTGSLLTRNANAQFSLPTTSVDGKNNPMKAGGNFFIDMANNGVYLLTGFAIFALIVCIGLGLAGKMPWKWVVTIGGCLLALTGVMWIIDALLSAKG